MKKTFYLTTLIIVFTLFFMGCSGKDEIEALKKENLELLKKNNTDLREHNTDLKQRLEKLEVEVTQLKEEADKKESDYKFQIAFEEIKIIGLSIENFAGDQDFAPKVKTIQELASYSESGNDFIGFYINALPQKDPWGNYYIYKTDNEGKSYWIASSGSDGEFKGFKQKGFYEGNENKDIIFSNGDFVFGPKIN
jgi:predicted component of type VI protein secretion system